MFKPTIDQVKKVFAAKGYSFFEGGKPYNLNVIGIRSASTLADRFNETLMVVFNDELNPLRAEYFPCTTKAGLHYLKNPLHKSGCAILAEGQYKGAYIKRKHRGLYYALCQHLDVDYYRDANLDEKHDIVGEKVSGRVGLNIHRESAKFVSQLVGKYSAGCTVIQANFEYFMFLVDMAIKNYKNRFTYTLINEKDFYPA